LRGSRETFKNSEHGRLFRSHIEVWSASPQCGLDQWRSRVDERPGAINDRCRSRQGAIDRRRVVHCGYPHLYTRIRITESV
jgi:hypothetical protein